MAVASVGEAKAVQYQSRPHRIRWARMLKRVFDIYMQNCPNCGCGDLKIVAAIAERPRSRRS